MTRVVLIGLDPKAVDYTDPALPPGTTAEKIQAGIDLGLQKMRDRGWEAAFCSIQPDDSAESVVERFLSATPYDCVVVGAGVRLPPNRLTLFETVLNAIHRAAPGAAIAFNTRPDDSADAAARRLKAE